MWAWKIEYSRRRNWKRTFVSRESKEESIKDRRILEDKIYWTGKEKESISEEINGGKRLLWKENEWESMIAEKIYLKWNLKVNSWWKGTIEIMYTRRKKGRITYDGKESEEEIW